MFRYTSYTSSQAAALTKCSREMIDCVYRERERTSRQRRLVGQYCGQQRWKGRTISPRPPAAQASRLHWFAAVVATLWLETHCNLNNLYNSNMATASVVARVDKRTRKRQTDSSYFKRLAKSPNCSIPIWNPVLLGQLYDTIALAWLGSPMPRTDT